MRTRSRKDGQTWLDGVDVDVTWFTTEADIPAAADTGLARIPSASITGVRDLPV
jgi:hypothetical protein